MSKEGQVKKNRRRKSPFSHEKTLAAGNIVSSLAQKVFETELMMGIEFSGVNGMWRGTVRNTGTACDNSGEISADPHVHNERVARNSFSSTCGLWPHW